MAAEAGAQMNMASVVRKTITETSEKTMAGQAQKGSYSSFYNAHIFTKPGTTNGMTNGNKTTVGGTRWYNYVEWLSALDNSVLERSYSSYMWNKANILSIYDNGSGADVADTVRLSSFGMVLDVIDNNSIDFNSSDVEAFQGKIGVRSNDDYKLDSVTVFGTYGRNPNKPNVVDTLRFSFVYGDNVPPYVFISNTGDTIFSPMIRYDSAANIAKKDAKSTTPVLVKDLFLTAADTNRTGGYSIGLNTSEMKIPAGNLFGVTVSFKSGDKFRPYIDTAFLGQNYPVTYNYGMFLPVFFEAVDQGEVPGAAHADLSENLNMGVAKYIPTWKGYDELYQPALAFSGVYPFEWPHMSFKISCATCIITDDITSVSNISITSVGDAYPNPSNSEVSIPFIVKQNANVAVNLSNTMGQVIKTLNLGKFSLNQAGKAVFDISDLSAGIYFYTVIAEGQRITKRMVVTH